MQFLNLMLQHQIEFVVLSVKNVKFHPSHYVQNLQFQITDLVQFTYKSWHFSAHFKIIPWACYPILSMSRLYVYSVHRNQKHNSQEDQCYLKLHNVNANLQCQKLSKTKPQQASKQPVTRG